MAIPYHKAPQAGRVIVFETPKLDLEAYISNYKGRTRFERLILIGLSSTVLGLDALKAAVVEAKQGSDVGRYEFAVSTLFEAAPKDPDAVPDPDWVEKTQKRVKVETDRMELELKGYKNNLIKESIRMGYQDLGKHYHSTGDLTNANRSFTKMRDFCTTNSHIVVMSMYLVNLTIDQRNWFAVSSNVQRIRTGSGPKYHEAEKKSAKLTAALAISQLASGNFRDAARDFINTDPRMASAKLDDPSDEESYNEILTPNDVAIYGGLCALASFNRDELQDFVLDHKTFRNYLELEPHIRRAISFFVSAKYSACLSILESWKADYLLDIYLQPHLETLYHQIRTKAIHQFFIPFSSVTFAALATAFNTDEPTIEAEVTQMIKQGKLDARIDLVSRVLLARAKDKRAELLAQALESAEEYAKVLHQRLLRMEISNAGLEVKAPKHQGGVMPSVGEREFNGGGSVAGDLMGGGMRGGMGPSMGGGGLGGFGGNGP